LIKNQDEDISKQRQELQSLNDQSTQLLAELTDKSLHNTFKTQAEKKKWAHRLYFAFSIGILLIGVVVGLITQHYHEAWQLNGLDLWLYRLFISTPIGLLYWLCVSNSGIALKLAEEYQHKASISETLSGYRKLWNLEHQDQEYRDLFDPIACDLIKNPADKIKISNKDVFENLADIAKALAKKDDKNRA
jgi:hypothetical protein